MLDGMGGSILLACLGLGLAWIAGAVALQTPGARELREDVQRSEILKRLNAALPPSGPILNALARFDPLPQISGPAPDVRPPDREDRARSRDPRGSGQRRARAGNCVRSGRAGLRLGGPRRHGRDERARRRRPGRHHDSARGRWGPPRRRRRLVRRRERPGASSLVGHLRYACAPAGDDPDSGTSAAILGFPENGGYDVQPGALRRHRDRQHAGRLRARPRAADDHHAARTRAPRQLWRADGGRRRRVVTTIFASASSGEGREGFGVPTGSCATRSVRRRAPLTQDPASAEASIRSPSC